MTKETWEELKKEQPREHEFIKCGKCGRGMTQGVFDKTGRLVKTLGKVSLNAVREATRYNEKSHKSSKGKVVGYLCNSCCR